MRLASLLALLVLSVVATATEIPPGYAVTAVRLSDGGEFLGRLADPREGRSWLWVTGAPYVSEREEVFVAFNVTVDHVALANGSILERWEIAGGGSFIGARVQDGALTGGMVEWGTGSGRFAGFAVTAFAR